MKYLLENKQPPPQLTFHVQVCMHTHAYLVSFMLFSAYVYMCVHMFMWGGYMWIQVHVVHVCAHRGKKPSWVSFPGLCLPCYKSIHSLVWNSSIRLDWLASEPRDLPGSVSQLWNYTWVPPRQHFYMGSGGHSGHCTPASFVDLSVSLATYNPHQFSERPNVTHS